jgi:16S rRNA G966 N2-methylase RsmD
VYQQQQQQQQQEQDAENLFLDPPFSRIKMHTKTHLCMGQMMKHKL